MQVCPELSSLPNATRRAATRTAASSATMTGLLPPSSSVTGVRCFAAAVMMCLAISGPPVKKQWSRRWSMSSCVSAAAPSTTATASGSRYWGTSRASSRRHRRRVFRRLEHGAVAGRDGADQRRQDQEHRVVPRADDPGDARAAPTAPMPCRAARSAAARCAAAWSTSAGAGGRTSIRRSTGARSASQASTSLRPRSATMRRDEVLLTLGEHPLERLELADPPGRAAGCARCRRSPAAGRRRRGSVRLSLLPPGAGR